MVGGGSLELQPFISRPPIGYGERREIEGDRERDRECTEERESVWKSLLILILLSHQKYFSVLATFNSHLMKVPYLIYKKHHNLYFSFSLNNELISNVNCQFFLF